MAISAESLRSRPSSFILNETRYELNPFDLGAQIYFASIYKTENRNGLEVLAEKLSDFGNFKDICTVVLYLLKDKRDFKNEKALQAAIEADGKYKKLTEIYEAVVECLGVSQPQKDELYNEIEAGKLKAGAV